MQYREIVETLRELAEPPNRHMGVSVHVTFKGRGEEVASEIPGAELTRFLHVESPTIGLGSNGTLEMHQIAKIKAIRLGKVVLYAV